MSSSKSTALADRTAALARYIEESSQVKLSLKEQLPILESMIDALVACSKSGGVVYACGNGGSACDAIHLTEELVARYLRERPGIRAQHFCDGPALTCWSNDYEFNTVFQRQVETHMSEKDILVVFSTSGNSENILLALKAAKKLGAKSFALLGKGGGAAKDIADIPLVIQSDFTPHIQESHIAAVHMLCDHLEQELFF